MRAISQNPGPLPLAAQVAQQLSPPLTVPTAKATSDGALTFSDGEASLLAGRKTSRSPLATREGASARGASGPTEQVAGLGVVAKAAQGLLVVASVEPVVNEGGTRIGDALRSLWDGFTSAVVGFGRNLLEAGADLVSGAGQFARGEVTLGCSSFAKGGLKLLQTPVDAALTLFGKSLSAVQTVSRLEAPGRLLLADEVEAARRVFGDSIDYSRVRIKEGDAGAFSFNERPFAMGDTLYMKSTRSHATLIHELTHVWQHQNGGTDYMSEALASQLLQGAYDWRAQVPGTPFADLAPEKQAAFLEDAFMRNAFASDPPAYPDSTRPPSGASLAELNAYLQEAIREVRAGRGAT